ncbi:biotin carboxyl carrier protein of acetyl-CoA carboxylase, chloroplastic [Beta vulgaris subsp. vulgaris]|uniref:biotin carboxyl carrier protein of acetyl-CoA carboxylase, chloroplastic n=1 Tax=Beta vulgaris subsp. vulgaris TaxID=3555 RepID=UPI002036CE64|nr:biotin carboxyl carrier protein of acetyl-CoA carboxylase, chloroplastic [Beta vulgaris subsp. vulgaris]
MAISLPNSSSSAVSETPTCSFLPIQQNHHHSISKISFSYTPKLKFGLFSQTTSSRIVAVKAQLNKVALDNSNNAPPTPQAKPAPPAEETTNNEVSGGSSPTVSASEESISEFVSQVASLVKLVDSRDIVELKLKQLDCEILIRKKEAVQQTHIPNPAHVITMQSPPTVAPSQAPQSSPPTSAPPLPALAPVAKPAKPSLPPFNSPMSGTFYRSPAPGEPPFVKVGDKVQKGQVICIIEAMKLMNEIEADQSGTVIDILAQDGKPISIESPLLVIQP